jgi:hypothetical protein
MSEQIEVLRRIAERALKEAQRTAPSMIDVCQHMLDEVARVPFTGEGMISIADNDGDDAPLIPTKTCVRFECQTWDGALPVQPHLVRRGEFWCCPRCGGSYGTNPHPELLPEPPK